MRKFINIITEASGPHQGDRSILSHITAPAVEETPEIQTNLPATINTALANGVENHFSPKWFKVSDLPSPFDQAVRQMGPMVFGHFTDTPVDDIEMMADFISGEHEVKEMIDWISHEGERLDAETLMPGHMAQSDCVTYRVRGYDFLLVRDAMGHYIYAWPSQHSKISGSGGSALPGEMPRLT